MILLERHNGGSYEVTKKFIQLELQPGGDPVSVSESDDKETWTECARREPQSRLQVSSGVYFNLPEA